MTDLRKAVEMAVPLLIGYREYSGDHRIANRCREVLEALRQALAQPEQEPVAWISDSPTKGNGKQLHFAKADAWKWSSNITPLYAAPPRKEWVGLTDEEVDFIADSEWEEAFVRLVEAKLKEKNNAV